MLFILYDAADYKNSKKNYTTLNNAKYIIINQNQTYNSINDIYKMIYYITIMKSSKTNRHAHLLI